MIDRLSQAVAELEQRRQASFAELQQAAVELSLAIASKLVYRVISADEFGVKDMVADALQRLPAIGPIRVALHPADLVLIQRQLAADSPDLLSGREVRFLPDNALERGCCRAELPEEGILNDLHLSLGDLHEELMEGLADARTAR